MTEDNSLSRANRSYNAIIDSAYHLFASQGYAATSMRQISDGAGLALGSIYNHFGSKDEIFEAVVLKRHPIYSVLPLIKDIQADSVDDLFRHSAHNMVRVFQQHPEFLNLLLIEIVEFKSKHMQLVLEKIYPDVIEISRLLDPFSNDLQDLPLPLLLRAFISMFFSFFVTEMLLNNFLPQSFDENSLDMFIEIFLNGIKNHSDLQSEKSTFLSGTKII